MLRFARPSSLIAAALVASLVLQPALAAAGTPAGASAAVYPVSDADADAETRRLAGELGELMRLITDRRIVEPERVEEIAGYQRGFEVGDKGEAQRLVASAKENYFLFRQREAEKDIDGAISLLEGRSLDRSSGPSSLDAYLTKAMIAVSAGDEGGADGALEKAIAIDPFLDIGTVDYPPRLVERFAEVKEGMGDVARGSLVVRSRPAGADVYLNGIMQGTAPVKLEGLPVGDYALSVAANRYLPDERTVTISPGGTSRVKSKLRWDEGSIDSPGGNGGDDLVAGLRAADALRVDRVVVLDADAAGDGSLVVRARLVDRQLRSALKPAHAASILPGQRQEKVALMASALAGQLEVDPLTDPQAMLDPVGEGDPSILGRRKKPITRRPLFWGAVGVAVAGAIAGGIAAAMSGGSDKGSVKVSFK